MKTVCCTRLKGRSLNVRALEAAYRYITVPKILKRCGSFLHDLRCRHETQEGDAELTLEEAQLQGKSFFPLSSLKACWNKVVVVTKKSHYQIGQPRIKST